jgi:hypothetical protein
MSGPSRPSKSSATSTAPRTKSCRASSNSHGPAAGQKQDSQESADSDRFAYLASLDTRFPRSLTLLPETVEVAGPNETGAHILGDLIVSGNRQTFASFGLALERITGATTVHVATLAVAPLGKGVIFRGSGAPLLYIPCGSAGYITTDGTSASAAITSAKPLNFVVHDKKLWMLDADGVIKKSLDGAAWTTVATIESDFLPRGLVMGFDRNDAPTPHAVTDSMTFAIDEGNTTVYETELNYAPHPYAGVAFERWRTDIYVAIGMGAQRYTLGTVTSSGLDRDDGCGPELSGYISSMCRGFNDLFLGVTAAPVSTAAVEKIEPDHGFEIYLSGSSARASVNRLTGAGVSATAWLAPELGGSISDLFVSTAQSHYRLYWAWKGRVYYQELSTDFDNPAQDPTQRFQPNGELISSWLDMGMAVDRMTMAAIELEVKAATATERITIDYQIDDDDETGTWRELVSVTAPGRYEVRVGRNGTLPDGQERYDGVGFGRMRYRVQMERDPSNATKRPVLEAVIISFLKRMRRVKSFDFTVDCSSQPNESVWGLGNRQRAELLERMIEAEVWLPFTYNNKWSMVRVAQSNGRDKTGMDLRGDREVSVIVPWEVALGA